MNIQSNGGKKTWSRGCPEVKGSECVEKESKVK